MTLTLSDMRSRSSSSRWFFCCHCFPPSLGPLYDVSLQPLSGPCVSLMCHPEACASGCVWSFASTVLSWLMDLAAWSKKSCPSSCVGAAPAPAAS
eukprot:CAMPEP_0206248980 /NCGR_PEP_ID=MMETSP0047_2-20121206/20663_1 /ASSEMBLY_ACC=CAM_ASM_000192 /TAXON_ID=195065 /ORGANISM="Chroomonas mesostigmatica_cf, Strain CCMP1168" /LENGTH=94 /DNA_ID=CAMNT_0053674669 /DNA_START=42 /DNA_END=323 /DNA_ORIENTATION=+